MGNNWPLVKLGDFVQISTGYPFKSKEYSEIAGVKLLRGDNIIQGALRWQNVKMLPKDKIGPKEQNYYLRTGDVILAMDRPWIEAGLKTAQVNESDLPCLLVQRVACLRCENPSDQDFIRYIISSYDFVQYVKSIQTGTAIPHISGKQIKDFEFRLPPRNIRKKIGKIIKQIDDKAHLNRQINQTLEQMAQALFKSWFVDFDPVVDNALDADFFEQDLELPDELLRRAEARQAVRKQSDFKPLPDATHQLFPAAFEESPEPSLGLGGWVPKGWEAFAISDIAFINKDSWTKNNSPQKIKYVDLSNAKDGIILGIQECLFEEAPSRARRVLKKRDTIFGMVRPANRSFAYVDRNGLTGSTGFVVISAKNENASSFIYQKLTSDSVVDDLIRVADGAAYPAIKPDDISELMMAIPSECILDLFEKIIDGYRERVAHNLDINEQLANLRDTLLPKLISGELQLDNIEAELATE